MNDPITILKTYNNKKLISMNQQELIEASEEIEIVLLDMYSNDETANQLFFDLINLTHKINRRIEKLMAQILFCTSFCTRFYT